MIGGVRCTNPDLESVQQRHSQRLSMARNFAMCDTVMSNKAVKGASAITSHYSVLQSTGCTAQFCEGGRMIHSTEPRVGENRSISVVGEEAIDFLCQLRRDEIIDTDEALQSRMTEVLQEIETNPVKTTRKEVDTSTKRGPIGGSWNQSKHELNHGIRLAWKHSRRCIMRSQYENLKLCDLRHIHTSVEMGTVLIEELRKAFNHGDVLPTVFVFPPRSISKSGPMIWNMQLLSFAGYEQDDGTVLGDPLNLELTKEIIELGWTPPSFRTKWDLLPLVTMAEDDEPAITEIPTDLFPLVEITHPNYHLAFDKLGLKWVPVPALSKLGFDIGGVQYTAAPFLGWFMDAEIGVRDLADQKRYNALPSLIECLGWVNSASELDEMQEANKLRLLSNAQSELNYAVYYSFQQSGVRMSDTLTASAMYCNFDDEHLRKFGFRLPADPYWLAPPQGSIIPLWHRGGSPNYQPKPLIARHVQDPIKAWKRRMPRGNVKATPPSRTDSIFSSDESKGKIHICYCTTGVTACKLAVRTEDRLKSRLESSNQFLATEVKSLNSLDPQKLRSMDVVLLIVSSSGNGSIPANGQEFAESIQNANIPSGVQWSIFGNGDSTFTDSYNGAAKKIRDLLSDGGAQFLIPGYCSGDTAVEEPPWNQLDKWLTTISYTLFRSPLVEQPKGGESADLATRKSSTIGTFSFATIVSCTLPSPNMRRLVLKIDKSSHEGFSHAQIIVPNQDTDVKNVLKNLRLFGTEVVKLGSYQGTMQEILTHFVDLSRPFTHARWVPSYLLSQKEKDALLEVPLSQSVLVFRNRKRRTLDLSSLCTALPLGKPRNYSLASSETVDRDGANLEFFIKCQPQGKFSSVFLSSATIGTTLGVRFTGTALSHMINDISTPIIAFATGSGIAPVKYILQQRIRHTPPFARRGNDENPEMSPISLFVGCRAEDVRGISDALKDVFSSDFVDILSLTPSNPSKWRAQDNVFDAKFRDMIIEKVRESCYVFVCASSQASKSFAQNLSALVGTDIKKALGERYVEEVFDPA